MAISDNIFIYDAARIQFELVKDYFSNKEGLTDLRIGVRTKDDSYVNLIFSDCTNLDISVEGLQALEKFRGMHE
tara:strand:+ start:1016 stop:1237 length:222 start_codon:yes stop_codon:yes gene_type:complete